MKHDKYNKKIMKFIQFFQENNGKYSMNRLLAFVICCGGLLFGFLSETLCLGLVTIGVGLIGWKNYDTRKKSNISNSDTTNN